jgi:hypothetical protein
MRTKSFQGVARPTASSPRVERSTHHNLDSEFFGSYSLPRGRSILESSQISKSQERSFAFCRDEDKKHALVDSRLDRTGGFGRMGTSVRASDELPGAIERRLLSVISPCHNESEVIQLFYDELVRVIGTLEGLRTEIIFVDDGSTDATLSIISLAYLAKVSW